MILRRIAVALKRQDWATVLIEFLLVVLGVLIALQVNNWNEARATKAGAISMLTLLRGEVGANIVTLERMIKKIELSTEIRRSALAALGKCDPSEEALDALGIAIGQLTGDIIPSLIDSAAKGIVRQDRYLDLLSDQFRSALNTHETRLADERDQLKLNFGLMWDDHVVRYPAVSININSDGFIEGPFSFNRPMSDLCKDSVFRRKFILTEDMHRSTLVRMQLFQEHSEEFLLSIDQELEVLE